MKKETGKEWLHGRRKRIAVVVVLAAAGAIAWLLLSLFSGAKEVGFEQVPEDELPEAITSDIIPEYKTLERALACCIDDDIYVIVTRGEKPTSGFKVAVDHMALEEQDGKSTLIVYAGFKDPDKKTAFSQIITYPTAVVRTDLKQLPKSIYLQLQRKQKDNEAATWEAVDYSGNISPEKNWVEVTPKYSGSSYVWSYTFTNLEQYVNSAAEAESKVPWIYRVMEVDAEGKEIASGETYTVDGKTYRVTYSMDASTGKTDPTSAGIDLTPASQETDKQPTVNMTVTNTYLEELNLKITKRGKNTTEDLLSGVQFKLEKKNPDGTGFELVGDPKTTVDGIATFEKLSQGTYRLIETKAAEGYNLLSDSILIEINESNQVKWKMEKEKETEGTWKDIDLQGKNEIPLTIYNTKQLILPATGGSGFGLVTMGGIALMAQAILMGTYFTLQCRKGDDKLRKKR